MFKSFKEHVSRIETENKRELAKLNEDFKESDLVKVGTLLTKLITKKSKLGKFTFIYKEDFKKVNGERGVGALFASDKGNLIRFNYLTSAKKSFSTNSMDFWEGKKIGTTPDKSITFQGKNIVKVVDQISDFISSGKLNESEGSYRDFEDLLEASAAERYAQRVKFAENYGIKKSYARSERVLRTFAEKAGVADLFDEEFGGAITVDSNVDEKTSKNSEREADEKQLGPKGVYADPAYVFKDMEEAAKVVAKGKWRSLIVAGMGGIGKSFGIKQVLTQELGPYGEGFEGKWAYFEGARVSAGGLYKSFLLNKKKIVVYDDSDSIWANADNINLLKIVTSDDGDRTLSQSTGAFANVALMDKATRTDYENEYISELMEDPNTLMKPPSMFNFEGGFINISNLPASKFDKAIKSRAIFIDVYLAERDVVRRMATIKKLQGVSEEKIMMLLTALVPDAADALEGKGRFAGEVKYITPEDARRQKTLNMRSMNIAEALYDAGVDNFQHMVSMYA